MTRTLNRFNLRKNPYAQADGLNPEGFPGFQRSLEESYLQLLLTNTLGGTYYANGSTLMAQSLHLHQHMAAQDAAFMARALVYARNEGLMRLQTLVGLAYLAKVDRDLFRQIFDRIILTPGDLSAFVEIVRGGLLPGGMGRAIKSSVNAWLNGMSEYHAIKYASGGQGYSLRDLLRLSHPRPATPIQDAIFTWLTDRAAWAAEEKRALTPQIAAFEQLKRAQSPAEVQQAITEGRLPYEVVTGMARPDADTWAMLMEQMPYFALLRHLNTLQRAGLFQQKKHALYAARRLRNTEAIRRARVLPFRLFMAHNMFQPRHVEEQRISDALVKALEVSFVNLPPLGKKVAIAPDVSGSMTGILSRRSQVRYQDIAGIFTGALLKASPNALVLPFENKVVPVQLSRHDSVMTNADKIRRLGGGGTALSAPVSELLHRREAVATFIGITDNVEWAQDQHGGQGFLPVWREYKRKLAPKAQAFLLTLAPYTLAPTPPSEPDVHYIYGWNDNVLPYMAMQIAGLGGQVAAVRQMAL